MIKVSQTSENKTVHYDGWLARCFQDEPNQFLINIAGTHERIGLLINDKDLDIL